MIGQHVPGRRESLCKGPKQTRALTLGDPKESWCHTLGTSSGVHRKKWLTGPHMESFVHRSAHDLHSVKSGILENTRVSSMVGPVV